MIVVIVFGSEPPNPQQQDKNGHTTLQGKEGSMASSLEENHALYLTFKYIFLF
jgi:hypothetical protein